MFTNGFLDVLGPEDPSAAVATALYQQDETESIEGPWLQLPADFFFPPKVRCLFFPEPGSDAEGAESDIGGNPGPAQRPVKWCVVSGAK